ncbi:hypothetical protein ACWD00_37060 [Streptomyces viridiviolaceus]
MAHHHKPNRAVEGDPAYGHTRGMPRRPDQDELDARTVREREEAGLPARAPQDADTVYRAVLDQVDSEANAGDIPTGSTRKHRGTFPPTGYRG